MSELQSTIEFSVELYKFYNVDLFQRGMYQVRCSLRVSSKLSVEVEVTTPEVSSGLGTAIVLGNYGACRPFQILYRNEEVSLKDVVLFRCHMLVDGNNLKESLERAEFSLILELWFSDSSPVSMVMVSSRTLQLNMSPAEGLHYHLPVLFDYFHLSAISLTIHAVLTALHQPSMKRGILRYMQSCAPKSSKSWSKIRSAHCSSLTDPVLPVSSHKIYSKINESPQIHLEARDVLLDASNNLKSTIKEYKVLFMQREETLSENYDTIILKPHRYESKKSSKKSLILTNSHNSCLAELCADNIRLWNYFLLNFSCKTTIQQHLSKKHHLLRVKRFAELFFLVFNPRRAAIGCFDTNYQNYLLVAEIAKRSKYMQNLPQLPVHCYALDGDNTTMPIIFEDQYQDPFDLKNSQNSSSSDINSKEMMQSEFKRSKTMNETSPQCSCGVENYWDMKKSSEKTLVNADLYNNFDDCSTMAARLQSKSLDQLQMCSKNTFHYSLANIFGKANYYPSPNYAHHLQKYERVKEAKLKNVASEHNMRTTQHRHHQQRYFFDQDSMCNCNYNNGYFTVVRRPPQKRRDKSSTPIDNEVNAGLLEKHLKKGQNKKIVKSLSHTSQTADDVAQNIFRSNSVQLFSPKKKHESSKFNSLMINNGSSRKNGRKIPNGNNCCVVEMNGHSLHNIIVDLDENSTKSYNQKSRVNKSKKRDQRYLKHFEIGSSSNSTNCSSSSSSEDELDEISLNDKNKIKTGLNSEALFSLVQQGIRKVRSTSCLGENNLSSSPLILLSGTESLPNIINNLHKIERMHQYPDDMKFYNSNSSSSVSLTSSSTTSEQSGWITSRSSSIASCSTDVTNPATSALITNIDNIQRKILNLSMTSSEQNTSQRHHHHQHRKEQKKKKKSSGGSKKFEIFTNGYYKRNGKFEFINNKGCEFNQICDDLAAVPPPKQFRDLDSPSSGSVTNGTIKDEEINAVDNILYHVVDTQTTLDDKSSSPSNYFMENKSLQQNDEANDYFKESKSEKEKSFLRAKNEFKGQLNFPGILYSDFQPTSFASSIPYFHISDEFRIFSPEGMHLIVCVHGLDGNSADLRLVKTYLELGLPGAYLDFLMSERNQGDTFSDFETMTDRLVSEILHYLDTSSIRPTRISFVGHSLGNVIVRSALTRPQMKFLLPRLHTFLSLSGPHLGTLYNSSGLVNMGMWFMQKWKKSGSLLQLCLKDSNDARQSFLYKLSQRSTLHHFKNVLLCGSGQDRYVPLHSARIELCKESIKDQSDQGAIYREMVHNIISPIIAQKDVNLVRYDIHHALPNTANALIGRAAHIAVLDSELFIEKFMAVVGIKYFR